MTVLVVLLAVPTLLLVALLVVCVGTRGPWGLGWFALWCAGLAVLVAMAAWIGDAAGDPACSDSAPDCLSIPLRYVLGWLALLVGPIAACLVEAGAARQRSRS